MLFRSDLDPDDIPIESLEFIGFRFLSEPEGRGRFVHEVDRLVGEVTVGYVPSAIHGRCDQKRLDSINKTNDGVWQTDG